MAIDAKQSRAGGQRAAGRRVLFGTNVVVVTVIVIGIVAVLQLIAYSAPVRWDMTSSGINSLSSGTENLLGDLDSPVMLTSLYFETDREEEDQPRYRRAVDDLLGLYEAANRGKVSSEWINPLKDHEKFEKLLARLREKGAFKDGIEQYKERIDRYNNAPDAIDAQMKELVKGELDRVAGLGGSMGADTGQDSVGQVEMALRRWSEELAATRETVDSLMLVDDPQYSAAVNELKAVYRSFTDTLERIERYGANEVATRPGLSPEALEYLSKAGQRYAAIIEAVDAEKTKLQELEPLGFDELLRELGPTANAILVQTDEDALVVDFGSVWPPLDPNMSGRRVPFGKRAFKGEEKVTAAILRATHKEQTAVVFVRYGGQPLFMGGFVPGMPAAPYATMKQQLEDANFIVEEWDLKTKDTPPEIDPAPTRTIYVVFKPTPPPQGPMGQRSQEPPFSESHKRAFLKALGDSGRALFVAGWYPGPYGMMPSTYEYNSYLEKTWGINVDTSTSVIHVASIEVGKFVPRGRETFILRDADVGAHPIVSGPQRRMALPMCAPVEISDPPPEGVERVPLVVQPKREDIWGARNLGAYQQQLQEREEPYMTRIESDPEGPFTLAVAAEKDDAKVVVISAAEFATDGVAFARELVFAEGIQLRSQNPGNVTLLVNSLHWLNDNTQFMDLGRPIDQAVLEVEGASTVRMVRVLTIAVWPILALACGGVAWWIRRR